MKAIILSGSPRKNGNTALIVQNFIKGFEDASGQIDLIDTAKLNIKPCTGCLGCENSGECVIEDDMNEIYKKTDESDVIVIASPVYFASVSAQLKLVIDRFQAYYNRKYVLNMQNEKKRKGYLIFTAGRSSEKMIPAMELCAKYFFLSCHADLTETIYALNTDKEAVKDRGEILEKAYNLGFNAAHE